MKNSADLGGCYPLRLKAKGDNILQNLHNSSYPTKAEINNCFIIHSKYFPILEGVSPFTLCFSVHQNNTTLSPGLLVNGSIICSGLHFDVILMASIQ